MEEASEKESDSSIISIPYMRFTAHRNDEFLSRFSHKSFFLKGKKHNYKICGHNLVFQILQRKVKREREREKLENYLKCSSTKFAFVYAVESF